MNGLKDIKNTPDSILKNITVNEISESQLHQDISSAPKEKQDAFKLKQDAELKGAQNQAEQFNKDGKLNEVINNLNNPNQYQFGQGENRVSLGSLLDAELATKMIDTLVPTLFVLLLRYGAGLKINKSEIQATNKELLTMQPIVQKCMDAIIFNINNPFVALGLVGGVIYSSKAAEVATDKYLTKKDMEEKIKEPRMRVSTGGNPKGAGRHVTNCDCEKCQAKRKQL